MSKFKNILIPFLLLLLCSLLTHQAVEHITDKLTLSKAIANDLPLNKKELLLLLGTGAGIISIAGTATLLLMSRLLSVRQIINRVIAFTIFILALFFFCLIPYGEHLLFPKALVLSLSSSDTFSNEAIFLMQHWYLLTFYGLMKIWPSAVLLLFYGAANEIFSFKEAGTIYPLFGVIAVILSVFIFPLFTPYIAALPEISNTLFWGGLLIGLSSLLHFAFNWAFSIAHDYQKEDSTEKAPSSSPFGWGYIWTLGALIGCSVVIIRLAKVVWKYNTAVQFPTPKEYAHYLGSFSMYEGIATLMTCGLLLFMSYCLRERSARGWKNFYYAISCFSLVLGGAFFFFSSFQELVHSFISSNSPLTQKSTITTVGAGYQILVSSVLYPIILSLKEVAIVPIPTKNRFTGKIVIDLFITKLALIFTSLILQFFIVSTGSVATTLPFLALIFFFVIGCRFMCIYFVGYQLEKASPQPATLN